MRFVTGIITAFVAALTLNACSSDTSSTYQGYVEGEFVHVASPVGGRLDKLFVQRGQTVAANAPLFSLEAEQEQAAQRQTEELLRSSEAQLADLKTGQRNPERDVVNAQLAQAEAAAQLSASQLTRDQKQYEIGGISRSQLEDSQARHAIDAARARELSSRLQVATLPARDEQIRMQSAQVAAARAALDQANWRLGQKQPAATQSALVFDTLYREGEWVPAGAAVVRMLPPANIKIRFFVPEATAGRLAAGKSVAIECSGCNAQLTATISFISPEPEYTPPVIYSNETRAKLVYMIEARPAPESAAQLHPGLPVKVIVQ